MPPSRENSEPTGTSSNLQWTEPLVSDKVFAKANSAAALGTIIIIPLFYVFKESMIIEQGDIQTMSEVIIAAGSIALAIPLFFKDVERGTLFWKHFFFLAFCFIAAAFLSIFCLIRMKQDVNETIELTLAVAFAIVFSCQIQATPSLTSFLSRKTGRQFVVRLDPTIMFILAIVVLLLSTGQTSGNWLVCSFLLLSFFGFYLLVVISLALVLRTSVKARPQMTFRDQIKVRIERIAQQHRHEALSKKQLIKIIITESPQSSEILNDTTLNDILWEMNRETEQAPKISLSNGLVIPRWNNEHTKLLRSSNPKIIVVSENSYRPSGLVKESFYSEERVLKKLADSSNLSIELLHDHPVLQVKYPHFEIIDFYEDYSTVYYTIATLEDELDWIKSIPPQDKMQKLKVVDDFFRISTFSLIYKFEPSNLTFYYLNLGPHILNEITIGEVLFFLNQKPQTAEEIGLKLFNLHFPEIAFSIPLKERIIATFAAATFIRLKYLIDIGNVQETFREDEVKMYHVEPAKPLT